MSQDARLLHRQLIHCLAAQFKQMRGVIKILGMTRKQQPIGLQQWRKPLQNFKLRFLIEINHHIAAENCI